MNWMSLRERDNKCMNACIHAHKYKCMNACIHAHKYKCMNACIHAHKYKCMNACIHAHNIITYTYIHKWESLVSTKKQSGKIKQTKSEQRLEWK